MVSQNSRPGHTQTRKAPGSADQPRLALERHDDRLLILISRGTSSQQRAFMLAFPGETRQLADLLEAGLSKPGAPR
jgi:hypothetical protein